MRERNYIFLIGIIFLALTAGWLAFSDTVLQIGPFRKEIRVHEGLDLKGGLQVVLEADLPPDQPISSDAIESARQIIENRINALGVVEPQIQILGNNRILVQLPGLTNSDDAIRTFGSTGQLEFIDAGDTPLEVGTLVKTTGLSTVVVPGTVLPTPTPTPTVTTTAEVTPTAPISPTYRTVMTGRELRNAQVAFQQTTNQPYIAFELTPDGAKIFGDHTTKNVNKYLAITLDKRVISSPLIKSPITEGKGIIEGRFTLDEAKSLVLQLKYGALPVPLKVIDSRAIGPTLGRDSVNRSITAGTVGLIIVVLFMLLYYRLPGFLAAIALTIYALIVFSIYKFGIPGIFDYVTLTLPGIAGFVLSVGMAVDANILIFERMKEELRGGRPLYLAIEYGFQRAWPSIRDSNISTLITCAILLWFGASFGASMVAGFALTLAIGVLVSLFTAIFVTRTFLRLVLDMNVTENLWWFGV
jgi:preprotein translocase subunit SecD